MGVHRPITRRPRDLAVLSVALLAGLAGAPVAHAAGGAGAILQDCQDDGHVGAGYSQDAYAKALASLPTDLDEYSDCRAEIRSAQLRAAAQGSTHGAGHLRSAAPAPAGPGPGGPSRGASAGRAAGGGKSSPSASASSASSPPPAVAPLAAAAPAPAAAPPASRPAPAERVAARQASVSPHGVAWMLALAGAAAGLAGALGPRYLPRLLRRRR
jgi:hypothetical protein